MPSLASTGAAVKVYAVNGAPSGSGGQPDWLGTTQTRSYKERTGLDKRVKKRRTRNPVGSEGKSLIQDFEFPEASHKIKSTPDGRYVLATGTYKPRLRAWDLSELSLKFDRVTDADNVDFLVLSPDWTKTLHLQSDRSLGFHNQSSLFHALRLPSHGRSLAYHRPSCDAFVGGTGDQLWRVNLSQGRFLSPFALAPSVAGVNAVDVNEAHGLVCVGTEGGTVEMWDPRARERAATLTLPSTQLLSLAAPAASLPGVDGPASTSGSVDVTALASRFDGLNLAVGTSTGHSLLYDLRSSRHYNLKDQGYGLPIKKLEWLRPSTSAGDAAAEGLIASMDSNVLKVWSRLPSSSSSLLDAADSHLAATSTSGSNLVSINPPSAPLNDFHFYPSSGLVMLTNEGSPLTAYFVPSLGPAPGWCRFLENLTEELDSPLDGGDGSRLGGSATIYDDYRFVDHKELSALGLDHLVGTSAVRPYMHGYFLDLRLYVRAKAIANPFAYEEHRAKTIRDKLDQQRESRIRNGGGKKGKGEMRLERKEGEVRKRLEKVKVNRELAKRLLDQRPSTKGKSKAVDDEPPSVDEEEDEEEEEEDAGKAKSKTGDGLLADPRFGSLFEDEDYEIDEYSKEYAMLNPSAVAARRKAEREGGLPDGSDEEEDEEGGEGLEDDEDGDSSDEGDLGQSELRLGRLEKARREAASQQRSQQRSRPQTQATAPPARARPRMIVDGLEGGDFGVSNNAARTFGQRLQQQPRSQVAASKPSDAVAEEGRPRSLGGGAFEMTFVPSTSSSKAASDARKAERKSKLEKKAEFGMGMSRGKPGDVDEGAEKLVGDRRDGRTKRRRVERSASKKKMRGM